MDNDNLMRIRALMSLLGLNIAMVAKAGGVSRPMLSMALAGKVRLLIYIQAARICSRRPAQYVMREGAHGRRP